MSFNEDIQIKIKKRFVDRQRSSEKKQQNKIPQIEINYKTIQQRKELGRRKLLFKRKKNELTQGALSPKTTKSKKITSKNKAESNLKKESILKRINTDSNMSDWINRQNIWMENKIRKLNERIVTETLKTLEKCNFEPKINKVNKKIISNLNIETNKIIQRPQSYVNYIRKSKIFRENKSNSKPKIPEYQKGKKENNSIKHKNKLLKINKLNNYDYTKHQLTEKNSSFTRKCNTNNNSSSITISSKSFNIKEKEKTRRSIPLLKLKLTNLSEDELYNMIYKNEKDKLNKKLKDYTTENEDKIFEGKKQIYFRQAMENLHSAIILINSDLDDETNGEEKSNNNEISSANLIIKEDNDEI